MRRAACLASGLPIIDQVPGMPRCWIALGYGGNVTCLPLEWNLPECPVLRVDASDCLA